MRRNTSVVAGRPALTWAAAAALLLLPALAGCGQKGPLTLPEAAPSAPAAASGAAR